nr:MAG: hypothetical protein [Bacteriophage sp.]
MTNNQLTPENVTRYANYGVDMMEWPDGGYVRYEDYAALAAELQERRKADSEPVAEVVSIYGDPESFGEREIRPLVGIQQMPCGTKLYRHAQPAPVVQDGYVMVPKEPTEEMLQASYREVAVYSPTAYRAMIAAAPQEVKP